MDHLVWLLFFLLVLVNLVSFVFHVIRRDNHILASRFPVYLWSSALFGVVFVFFFCLYVSLYPALPCELMSWAAILYYPTWAMPFFLRCIRLIFRSHWMLHIEENSVTPKKDWFFRNKGLVSDKFFVLVICITLVVHLFSGFLVQYIIPIEGNCLVRQQYLEVFWIFIYGGAFLVVIASFLRVKDPFYMKFELFWTQVMCGAFVLVFALLVFLQDLVPGWEVKRYYLYAGAVFFGICMNGFFPVVLSYVIPEHGRLRRATSSNSITARYGMSSFDELFKLVLQSEFLLDQFQAYAVRGWFVESVLFVRAVDRYQTLSDDQLAEAGMGIIENFLGDTAALMINVDHKLSNQILALAKENKFSRTIFDEAHEEVRRLLKEDGFMKWKNTDHFQAAMEVAGDSLPQLKKALDLADAPSKAV